MQKSESIQELAVALCKAQGVMGIVLKESDNPFTKKKYADLTAYLKVIKAPLAEHGLSVVQLPSFSEEVVHVETVLLHESGQFISGITSAPVSKLDAQGVGSAITYCRRYGLAAILSLGAEDDDGHSCSNAQPEPYRKKIVKQPVKPLDLELLVELELLIKEKAIEEGTVLKWLDKAGVEELGYLTHEQASRLIDMLQAK